MRRCLKAFCLSAWAVLSLVPGLDSIQWLDASAHAQATTQNIRQAPAPLFRDPIYEGPADPVLIYNRQEQSWWMLYTQRLANQQTPSVSYCYGTDIGIASSKDNGRTWVYRGTLDLAIEPGKNTFWAPDVVYDEASGEYHLFVTYIQGVYVDWGGRGRILHYTSKDLWHWESQGDLNLFDQSIIDPTVSQLPDGTWRMWYKDHQAHTRVADSQDLKTWQPLDHAIVSDQPHEGPIVFWFKGKCWLLTDQWAGMGVYRSDDATNWEKVGLVMDKPSDRPGDQPSGAHGDVVVIKNDRGEEQAYIFYFTHPDRQSHLREGPRDSANNLPYEAKRSLIQVAELQVKDGTLVDVRKGFDFYLPNHPEE